MPHTVKMQNPQLSHIQTVFFTLQHHGRSRMFLPDQSCCFWKKDPLIIKSEVLPCTFAVEHVFPRASFSSPPMPFPVLFTTKLDNAEWSILVKFFHFFNNTSNLPLLHCLAFFWGKTQTLYYVFRLQVTSWACVVTSLLTPTSALLVCGPSSLDCIIVKNGLRVYP